MIKAEVVKSKCKIEARGNNIEILGDLLDINNMMFRKFIFREEINIPTKDKYEIIDSFVSALKEELEKTATF